MLSILEVKHNSEEYYVQWISSKVTDRLTCFRKYRSVASSNESGSVDDLLDDLVGEEKEAIPLEPLKTSNIKGFETIASNFIGCFQYKKKGTVFSGTGKSDLMNLMLRCISLVKGLEESSPSVSNFISLYDNWEKCEKVQFDYATPEHSGSANLEHRDCGICVSSLSNSRYNLSMQRIHVDSKINSPYPIAGLELDNFLKTDITNRDVMTSVKVLGAKTYAQITDMYDLSWMETKDYKILTSMAEVRALVERIEREKPLYVVIDSETTGLNIFNIPKGHPNKDYIIGMIIGGFTDQGYYIPFFHEKCANVDIKECLRYLKPYLETWKIGGANLMFDGKVFWDCGIHELGEPIRLNICYDTQILAFHLGMGRKVRLRALRDNILKDFAFLDDDEKTKKRKKHQLFARSTDTAGLSLKAQTRIFFGWETLELKQLFNSAADAGLLGELEAEVVRIYTGADGDCPRQLHDLLYPLLPADQRAVYQLDCEVSKELVPCEYYGNPVDMELLTVMNKINNADLDIMKSWIQKYVGQVCWLSLEKTKWKIQGMSDEDIATKEREIKSDPEFRNQKYEFKVSSNKVLADLMFNILKYPIVRRSAKTGEPSADKFAIDDLMKFVSDEKDVHSTSWLREPIYSSIRDTELGKGLKEKDKILIYNKTDDPDVKKNLQFANLKFPLTLMIKKWRSLDKLRGSFFEKLLNENIDGFYYTSNNLTAAETSRIINPIQTLIKALKKLICTRGKGWYKCVFDYAQIEYRVMPGEAGDMELVVKLYDPEADYHREGGAALYSIKPEDMTGPQRSAIKSVNFAKPYGMGPHSLAENIYGRPVTADKLAMAEDISYKWDKARVKIKDMLEAYRDTAVTTYVVENRLHRRRYFEKQGWVDVMNKDGSLEKKLVGQSSSSIRRMAGNFPIQSLAAEIFKIGFRNFRRRVRNEGLEFKVYTGALIHDEMVNDVMNEVHPYRMYAMVEDEVMFKIKGHPTYFAGVSICNNWYEGKDDLYEAPVKFLQLKAQEWRDGKYLAEAQDPNSEARLDPVGYVLKDILAYMQGRYWQHMVELQPEILEGKLDVDALLQKYKNYFLKPRMTMYIGKLAKLRSADNVKKDPKDKDAWWDDKLVAAIEKSILQELEQVEVKYPDGSVAICKRDNTREWVLPRESENGMFKASDSFTKIHKTDNVGSFASYLFAGDMDAKEDKDEDVSDEAFMNLDFDDLLNGEDSYEDFSVPTLDFYNAMDEQEAKFEYKTRTDMNQTWSDLIVAKSEVKVRDANNSIHINAQNGKLIIEIPSDATTDNFNKLKEYLTAHRARDEASTDAYTVVYYQVTTDGKMKSYTQKYSVENFDTREIADILGKDYVY